MNDCHPTLLDWILVKEWKRKTWNIKKRIIKTYHYSKYKLIRHDNKEFHSYLTLRINKVV